MIEEREEKLGRDYIDYMRSWSKRYLGRVRATIHTVKMLRSEIAELESMFDGVGAVRYDRDNVRSTPDDDGMVRLIERKDSLIAEYRSELDANLQVQADAHRALRGVRQPWRAVLTYRYIEGLPWAEVAERVDYSEVHCKTDLHDNGLVELFAHIPHEFEELPQAI